MNESSLRQYVPKQPNPLRQDAPGTVKAMPRPVDIGHIHIFSDEKYAEMVEFYVKFFNAEVTAVNPEHPMTFITYDDVDHRLVVMNVKGLGTKPEKPVVGYSHLAFFYSSLAEVLYIYKRMKDWGYPAPQWTVNHGNSTSFYYLDPDGNQLETAVDNYAAIETKMYKKHYQFSDEFGPMRDGDFDPDKMLALHESGVPDTVLLDRDEVIRLKGEGRL